MDATVIAAIGNGDERAFEAFYDRHAPAVARYAWSLSPSLHVAQDITQETFLTAWHKRSSIRLVAGSALPWLLATCRNHARNRARKDRKWSELVELHDDSIATDPINGSAAAELHWVLESILAMPEVERRVCELCLLQGFSYREAAEQLGISESAAGKKLQRARTKLRNEVTL